MTAFTSIGAGLAAGILLSIATVLYRKHLARVEIRRIEQLRGLARTRDLSVLDGALPRHLYDRAHDLGRPGRYRVCDAMVGRDDRGSYYFARRVADGNSIQMLLFDANKDTRIDGFCLAPRRRSGAVSQWQRLFGRLIGRKYNDPVSMELHWKCRPAELLQEGLLERATYTMRAVADACHRSTSTALGIHVDGKRIAVFAERGLNLRELDLFMKTALDLRDAALNVLLDLRLMGSASGAIRPISEAIADVASKNVVDSKGIPIDREKLREKQNSGAWSLAMDLPVQTEEQRLQSDEVAVYTSGGWRID